MAGAHPQEVDLAFAGNRELRKRVHAAIGASHCMPYPYDELNIHRR